jgi:hypothetical protein
MEIEKVDLNRKLHFIDWLVFNANARSTNSVQHNTSNKMYASE